MPTIDLGFAPVAPPARESWVDEPVWASWERPERPRRRRSEADSYRSLRQAFEKLAEEWERETEFESIVTRMAMHPAYQRIIGLGVQAVPWILERLERSPRQWFWALTSITGEDPAEGEDTADGAAEAWLRWGRDRAYIG